MARVKHDFPQDTGRLCFRFATDVPVAGFTPVNG